MFWPGSCHLRSSHTSAGGILRRARRSSATCSTPTEATRISATRSVSTSEELRLGDRARKRHEALLEMRLGDGAPAARVVAALDRGRDLVDVALRRVVVVERLALGD